MVDWRIVFVTHLDPAWAKRRGEFCWWHPAVRSRLFERERFPAIQCQCRCEGPVWHLRLQRHERLWGIKPFRL